MAKHTCLTCNTTTDTPLAKARLMRLHVDRVIADLETINELDKSLAIVACDSTLTVFNNLQSRTIENIETITAIGNSIWYYS